MAKKDKPRLSYTEAMEQVLKIVTETRSMMTGELTETLAGYDETLGAIRADQQETNAHLAILNGSVAQNREDIGGLADIIRDLPCTEHGISIARVEERVKASPSPREIGRMEAQVDMQPSPREIGRQEEKVAAHAINWSRVWSIAQIPITFVIGVLLTLALTGQLPAP